ncbi:alpha/beta hydrolase [Cellulomonas hominis]|uniref:alpha/beta hydrolase n=1 Tax=Cellulomonas hominis TaxID=156981 RepID=UPI001B907211|nr:alpha/beta hydrolase-fold protein [Cellulomonas hominis]VTR75411.1 Endo-1,4-beta-xylanase Z [Cellulomonas hominis]
MRTTAAGAEVPAWPGWLVLALLGLATVGAVVLVVRAARGRRRRHRRWVPGAALGGAGVLVLLAVTAVVASGVASGYLTDLRSFALVLHAASGRDAPEVPAGRPADPPRPTTDATGVAWQVTVPSGAAGVPDAGTWVYVPPGYSQHPDRRYPVVYLLHGSPGTGSDWVAAGHVDRTLDALVASGAVPPVVVVMPDVDLGLEDEPVDYPPPGAARGTFVVHDVVPWADAHLRTVPDAPHRVVGGMSAGGFGALLLALEHRDVFGGVVDLMPYLEPVAPALRVDPGALAAASPLVVVPRAGDLRDLPVFLGVPSADDPTEGPRVADALRAAGAPVALRRYDAGHDWSGVRRMTPEALTWIATRMGWPAE